MPMRYRINRARAWRFEGSIEFEYRGHAFSVTAIAFKDDGRLFGPPEKCYPPERGVEVHDIRLIWKDGRKRQVPDRIHDILIEDEDFLDQVFCCISERARED